MKLSYPLALGSAFILSRLTCPAGTLDFHFSVWVDTEKSRNISMQVDYHDMGDVGASAARAYEQNRSNLNPQERDDAFRYYIGRLKFVSAERLAIADSTDMGQTPKNRASLAVGISKLHRGDFEEAATFLKSADEHGQPLGGYLRVPICSLILGRPEEAAPTIKQIVNDGAHNRSVPAAEAVVAYCQVAKDGAALIDQAANRIYRELLIKAVPQEILEGYLRVCRRYGKEGEIDALRQLYEAHSGGSQQPRIDRSVQAKALPADFGVDIDFHAGANGNTRTIWLRIRQDASKGGGASAVQQYEHGANLSESAKFEAFRYYISSLKFVQAELLAESFIAAGSKMPRSRSHLALGIAQLCRGNYEESVSSLRSAELAGNRAAAFLGVHVESAVLLRPNRVQDAAIRIAKTKEFNSSKLAARALLAYCSVAKDGTRLFEEISKEIDRELIASDEPILELYAGLCKKLGRSEEVMTLQPYLKWRKERVFSDTVLGVGPR